MEGSKKYSISDIVEVESEKFKYLKFVLEYRTKCTQLHSTTPHIIFTVRIWLTDGGPLMMKAFSVDSGPSETDFGCYQNITQTEANFRM